MNTAVNNILIEKIGDAILKQNNRIILPEGTTFEEVRRSIRIFMRKHPEIFWFSHQYMFKTESHELKFRYNFLPKKKEFFQKEIDKSVRYLFQPDRLKGLSDLEKVAYVYKWLVFNTTYNDYSSFNQTIYSVLINRNSVCTGYGKTAQYLLRLVGIESELVFGKFHADKSDGGRHGWNIVKIEGDWYHVDFCLADPELKRLLNSNEKPIEHDGLLWNYFCKPTDYILKNRSIEFLKQYPECIKEISQSLSVSIAKPEKQIAVCKSDSGISARIYLDSFDKNRVIKISRGDERLIDNEFNILSQLKGCNHVVKLWGKFKNALALEQLTPWNELLNSHYYHPTKEQLKSILIQLTKGLIECRARGITYSDIHYNNIFVSKDGTYKWGDFGIAYPIQANGVIPSNMIGRDGIVLGSRWFMSPETYHNRIFTESSAIYSLAMLAYFVMNEMCPPFLSLTTNIQEALNKLLSRSAINPPINSSSFGSLSGLVCNVLNAKQSQRPQTFEGFIALLKSDLSVISPIVSIDDNANHPSRQNYRRIFAPVYDTDSFACTCGLEPTSNQQNNRHNRPTSNISNTTKPIQDNAVTYVPQKHKVKPSVSSASNNENNMIFGFISNMFSLFRRSRTSAPDYEQVVEQTVNACVYAPAEVRRNKSFIIRVYMYKPNEKDVVDSKINKIDPSAVKKEYKPLDLPVKEGDKITVRLNLSEGVQCKDLTKSVIWRGHYTDCSFMAKLINDNLDSIEGTACVFVNDLPAGEMLFIIDVVESQPREVYAKIKSHRFSKIFISYAHKDLIQVRGIAEGCKILGADYFFDRHSLQAGDIFKDKILNYIENADLFVLCWSKNAAESEWVYIEREHALKIIREGKSSLSIYPLCLRPEAPLPKDMSDKYNFGML